jgi:hypothetical protein
MMTKKLGKFHIWNYSLLNWRIYIHYCANTFTVYPFPKQQQKFSASTAKNRFPPISSSCLNSNGTLYLHKRDKMSSATTCVATSWCSVYLGLPQPACTPSLGAGGTGNRRKDFYGKERNMKDRKRRNKKYEGKNGKEQELQIGSVLGRSQGRGKVPVQEWT